MTHGSDAVELSTKIDCRDQNLISLPSVTSLTVTSLQPYQLLLTLNCSSNKLTTLPWDIGTLVTLQTLNCSYNHITVLPASIEGLTSLTRLDCSSNKLKHLPDSIGTLHRLHYLNCSSNIIHTLPHSIEQLGNLCKLKSLWNHPGCLNSIQLWKLRNLSVLHADLITIPSTSCVAYMTNLTSVVTSMECVTEYDPGDMCDDGNPFDAHDVCNTVGACNQQDNCSYIDNTPAVESLIAVMAKCKSLQTFHANSYTIDALPVMIGSMQSLTSLHCTANQLSHLPCTIGQLVNLTDLNLEENLLTFLPPTIGCLTALVELNLQSNKLKTLPDELYGLTTLETLMLCSNELTTLSPWIVNLDSLQTFVYFNNPIQLPPNVRRFVDLIPSINQPIDATIVHSDVSLPHSYMQRVCHILSQPLLVTPEIFSAIMQEIHTDPDLWDDTKAIMVRFCHDTTVDTNLFVTYQELLAWSWWIIRPGKQTKQRLNYLTTMVMNRPVHDRLVSLVASMDNVDMHHSGLNGSDTHAPPGLPCINTYGPTVSNVNQFYVVRAIYNAMTHYGVNCKANQTLFFREVQHHVRPGTPTESNLMKRYIDHLVRA